MVEPDVEEEGKEANSLKVWTDQKGLGLVELGLDQSDQKRWIAPVRFECDTKNSRSKPEQSNSLN